MMASLGRIIGLAALCVAPGIGISAQESKSDLLRQEALELVNDERGQRGLPELRLEAELNEAALRHARDMHERGYYAHESPDGENVMDRYLTVGGARWRLVTENIVRCENCAILDEATLKHLHKGWMNSPEHRANILNKGLDRFGFGAAGSGAGGLYAIQTFSGPGTPRGLKESEHSETIGRNEQVSLAYDMINKARADAALQPLEHADALRPIVSRTLAKEENVSEQQIQAALSENEKTEWATLQLIYARCGGCGEAPTEADVRYFVSQWRDDPHRRSIFLEPNLTHFDFAVEANGKGRKDAAIVLGERR
jgi:uncharacterized protein YkwD